MILHEINPFLLALREKGYKAESNRMAMGHAAHQFWKGVHGPGGKRLYTMEVRMHDRSEYPGHDVKRFGRWGVSYRMWVNHTTSADVDRLSVDVMHETMEVEEWERRCGVLWGAMANGFLGVAPPSSAPGQCSKSSPAEPGSGLSAHVPNAGTILGYFTRGPLKWMLTEREGGMLKGVDITPLGKVHTMHMAESSADTLVLINNDDYCLACWNTMPVGETCAVCGRVNTGQR